MTSTTVDGTDGDDGDGRYLPAEWTLPDLDEHNEAYFTAGRLLLEECSHCRHVQHPPSGVCAACQTPDTRRIEEDATGTVVSATVVHHPLHPMLRDTVPYNVVVVQLHRYPDIRIVGNVVGTVDRVPIGVAVAGTWTGPLGDHHIRLLQWRLV